MLPHCRSTMAAGTLKCLHLLQVTVFSTSEKKKDEALKVLKADHFVVSKDEDAMQVTSILSALMPCTAACSPQMLACIRVKA